MLDFQNSLDKKQIQKIFSPSTLPKAANLFDFGLFSRDPKYFYFTPIKDFF